MPDEEPDVEPEPEPLSLLLPQPAAAIEMTAVNVATPANRFTCTRLVLSHSCPRRRDVRRHGRFAHGDPPPRDGPVTRSLQRSLGVLIIAQDPVFSISK
jgi:hypothetical protein